jgi:hypothetical protein
MQKQSKACSPPEGEAVGVAVGVGDDVGEGVGVVVGNDVGDGVNDWFEEGEPERVRGRHLPFLLMFLCTLVDERQTNLMSYK